MTTTRSSVYFQGIRLANRQVVARSLVV